MFQTGLMIVLFGFGMVFAVLILLIFIVLLISKVTRLLIKETPQAEKPVPAAAPAPAADTGELTGEALAAVSCALAEALGKDAGQLIIRSVKRV